MFSYLKKALLLTLSLLSYQSLFSIHFDYFNLKGQLHSKLQKKDREIQALKQENQALISKVDNVVQEITRLSDICKFVEQLLNQQDNKIKERDNEISFYKKFYRNNPERFEEIRQFYTTGQKIHDRYTEQFKIIKKYGHMGIGRGHVQVKNNNLLVKPATFTQLDKILDRLDLD